MIRLEKNKLFLKLSEEEQKLIRTSLVGSETLCKLFRDILGERAKTHKGLLKSSLGTPHELSGHVQCMLELEQLTRLFDKTTKE
jgi:hypothetical protein